MRRTSMAIVGLLVSAGLVAAPSPARADFDLTVTWPAKTVINTTVSTYEIGVSDTGPGDLEVRWSDGSTQSVPHSGNVPLTPHEGVGRFTVFRCDTGVCADTGVSSPSLAFYGSLSMSMAVARTPRAQQGVPLLISTSTPVPTGPIGMSWRLVADDAPGVVVNSGTRQLAANFSGEMSVRTSGGLDGHTYQLQATFAANPGDGTVTDVVTVPVVFDGSPPITSASQDLSVIFPFKDGFRDRVTVTASSDQTASYIFSVHAESGGFTREFGREPAVPAGGVVTATWNGKDAARVPVAPGRYILSVSAVDEVGNRSLTEIPVDMDAAKIATVSWSAKTRPGPSQVGAFVGRCSDLLSPSAHGWPDSLGLASGASCSSTRDRADQVVVRHAMAVPESIDGEYSWLRVDALSGKAPGAKGSTARLSYIDAIGHRELAATLQGRVSWTLGRGASAPRDCVHVGADGPFVSWQIGVRDGSRFDVRRYGVTVRYQALVEPDGTVIPTPE